MKKQFFLSKKQHRLNIQQKNTNNLTCVELSSRLQIKGFKLNVKNTNICKMKSICKINGVYGKTNKHTNLNRHFIRLNLNSPILLGWSKIKW